MFLGGQEMEIFITNEGTVNFVPFCSEILLANWKQLLETIQPVNLKAHLKCSTTEEREATHQANQMH